MRYALSSLLILPLGLLAALGLCQMMFDLSFLRFISGTTWGYLTLAWSLAFVVVYIMQPQIDWWWFSKYPPVLDKEYENFLGKFMPYYRGLSHSEKARFGARVMMVLRDKQIMFHLTDDEAPDDLKIAMAASIVQFTFGWDEYWLPTLEKVIVYPSAFPSRERTDFHWCEAHSDGCIIIGAEALRQGFIHPAAYYQVGLHTAIEFHRLYQKNLEGIIADKDKELVTKQLAAIRCFNDGYHKSITGLDEISLIETAIEHFFAVPMLFQRESPALYATISKVLNQNPLNETYPILTPLKKW